MNNQQTTDEKPSWEFDTVRGRPSGEDYLGENGTRTPSSDSASDHQPHQPVNARLPTSLRAIFGEDGNAPPDPFRFPNFSNNSRPHAPSSPAPRQDRLAARKPLDSTENEDAHTVRQANFVFPPRPQIPRMRSKLSMNASGGDDESTSSSPEKLRLLPVGPGMGRGIGIGDSTMSSTPSPKAQTSQGTHSSVSSGESTSSTNTARPGGSYREVRTSRGVPDIAIPPTHTPNPQVTNVDGSSSVEASPSSIPSPPQSASRQRFSRVRSQSSAAATPSSSRTLRNQAFPMDYQFPSNGALPLPPVMPAAMSHRSTNSAGNEHPRIPVVHQSAHSFDNAASLAHSHGFRDGFSAGSSLAVEGGIGLPPSLSRAHSSTALNDQNRAYDDAGRPVVRRPSLTRQASVAVMENVGSSSTSPKPSGAFSPGPSFMSRAESSPIPGLKDVLKVPALMTDMHVGNPELLPPSPSAATAGSRFFSPTPSSLSTSVTSADLEGPQPSPSILHTTQQPPNSLQSSFGFDVPVTSDGVDSRLAGNGLANHSVSSLTLESHSHTASISLTPASSSSPGAIPGPMIRPLDFGALMSSSDSTHAELARTVDELVQWLHVVETGLTVVLDKSSADATDASMNHIGHTNGDPMYDLQRVQSEKEPDSHRTREPSSHEGTDSDDFFDSSRPERNGFRTGSYDQFLDLESDEARDEDMKSDFSSDGHYNTDFSNDNPVNFIRSQLAARS